jgi:predicted porin
MVNAAVAACLGWVAAVAAASDPDFIDAGPREMLVPYATIDVYQDLSDVGGRTTNALRPSGMSPTYLGFKGRREVDTGGFVGFQIEQTFDPVQGTWNHKVIGDRILTLDANGRWGYLRVGRQFTPQSLLMGAEVDAFQAGFWGSPYAVWDGGVPLMLRANAVSWQSVPLGGVSVHAMLAHDAEAADPAPRKQDGAFFKVEWDGDNGEFIGAVVVDEHNRDRSNWRRLAGLGAGWPVWGINWTIGVQLDDRPADRRYSEWALGATKSLGPHDFRLSMAGSSAAATSLGGRVYGVAYVFHLTSVLSLYTSLARLQNARLSAFDFGVPVAPGQPATDLMAGVRARF